MVTDILQQGIHAKLFSRVPEISIRNIQPPIIALILIGPRNGTRKKLELFEEMRLIVVVVIAHTIHFLVWLVQSAKSLIDRMET